nr:zinc finger and BTB domain-containing protein 49-like [Ciona intestinalis]XP_026690286.1 zinc finger and BTB domain-containing protein 49-like [Ciona intestinalis]|eukprot:XP_026690285.1 zinc finger and BTB domain-containing protein 49-like [Ciona intestinalis]
MENSFYLKSIPLHVEGHGDKLLKALYDQQRNCQLCDVSLIVENNSFPAHKAVLASYSSYFQALFDRGKQSDDVVSKVCNVTTIHLSSVSSKTFIPILHFLYTSKLHLFEENIRDVMKTAGKLQIHSIVQACERVIDDKIVLPSIHEIKTLNIPCTNVINENSTPSVLFVDLKSEDDDEKSCEAADSTNASFLPSSSDDTEKQKLCGNRTLKKKSNPKKIKFKENASTPENWKLTRSIDNISTISPTSIFGRIGSQAGRRVGLSQQVSTSTSVDSANKTISSTSDFSIDPLIFEPTNESLGNIFDNDPALIVDDLASESCLLSNNFTEQSSTSLATPKTTEALQVQSVYSISPKLTKKVKLFNERSPPEMNKNYLLPTSVDKNLVPSFSSSLFNERHTKPSVYTCKECLKYFTNITDAFHHCYTEHQQSKKSLDISNRLLDTKSHSCQHCGRIFNNKNNLKRHILIKHTADKRFKCSHCGRRYAIRQSLQYHIKSVHNKSINDITVDSPQTSSLMMENFSSLLAAPTVAHPTSSLTFSSSVELNEDVLNEAETFASTCTTSYLNQITTIDNLPPKPSCKLPTIQHIESIRSPGVSLPDDILVETGMKTSVKTKSTASYQGGSPFVLSESSKLPALLPALPEDQKKSPGDFHQITSHRVAAKLHRCDHCGHIFPTVQAFTRHKRACNKYECPICHRGFSQVGNMRRHMKIFHSDQKPFECKVCNKAYGIQQSFRYHMRDKHGIILGKPNSKAEEK